MTSPAQLPRQTLPPLGAKQQDAKTPSNNPMTTAEKPPAAPKRKVYTLHSGVNDPQNTGAKELKKSLMNQGVAEKDIIVLPTPYPSILGEQGGMNRNAEIFRDSANPGSGVAQEAYRRFEGALKQNGVKPEDEIIWVGHSAGGQMGMSMSKMAKDNGKYRISTLVTLGTPVYRNLAPPEVKVRNYQSPQDEIVSSATEGALTKVLGVPIQAFPPLDNNDKIRIFSNMKHDNWTKDPRVASRILSETNPKNKRDADLAPSATTFFGRLGEALDKYFNLSVEDLPETQ